MKKGRKILLGGIVLVLLMGSCCIGSAVVTTGISGPIDNTFEAIVTEQVQTQEAEKQSSIQKPTEAKPPTNAPTPIPAVIPTAGPTDPPKNEADYFGSNALPSYDQVRADYPELDWERDGADWLGSKMLASGNGMISITMGPLDDGSRMICFGGFIEFDASDADVQEIADWIIWGAAGLVDNDTAVKASDWYTNSLDQALVQYQNHGQTVYDDQTKINDFYFGMNNEVNEYDEFILSMFCANQ